jgi:hypothetical protein
MRRGNQSARATPRLFLFAFEPSAGWRIGIRNKGKTMKTKIMFVAALAAIIPVSQALAQSSGEPATPKATGVGSGTEPGGMGSTGWTGGAADKTVAPAPSYRSPVATGLDLKGPTRTE